MRSVVSLGFLSVAVALASQSGCGSSNSHGFNGDDGGGGSGGGLVGDDGGSSNDPCILAGKPSTTISGVVFDPAGLNPLYDVIVFVPGASLKPFPNGVSCDQCGVLESGSPIVSTLTDPSGKFTLTNVPPGDGKHLVMQIGKWRKEINLPHIESCKTTMMTDPSVMRLPAKKSEGDIPQFAIATGGADPFECLFRKIGIDDSEFTDPSANGRIHIYQGMTPGGAAQAISASTPAATTLWSNAQGLLNYDMIINACEGKEHPEEKPQGNIDNLVAYADKGGRLFNTHYQYFWLAPSFTATSETSPWTATGAWHADQFPDNGTETENIDDTYPKGKAFSQWLLNVGASTTPSQLDITQTRYEVDSVKAPALRWIYGIDKGNMMPAIMHMTFNTPWNASSDKQCGKVLYSDFHVVTSNGGGVGGLAPGLIFPQECDTNPMSAQEKALEFMLFDLSACIQNDTQAPQAPAQ